MVTTTYINTWKPSLTEADAAHLKSLGLFGALIKGNPYRSHLKKQGDSRALCGAEPGSSKRTRKMVDRTGWLVYHTFERPGCAPCEKCLKCVESLPACEGAGGRNAPEHERARHA